MTATPTRVQRILAITNLARRFGAFMRWQFEVWPDRVLTVAREKSIMRPTPTETGATRQFTPDTDLSAVCAFLEVARTCEISFDCDPVTLVEAYKGFRSWLANSRNLPEFVSNRHKKGMGNRVDKDDYLTMVAQRHAIDAAILNVAKDREETLQCLAEQDTMLDELIAKNAGK